MNRVADVAFVNGSVYTVDSQDRITEAAAVAGSKILHAGTSKEVEILAGAGTRIVDLAGRSLLPGFIDAHCHAGMYGARKLGIQCGPRDISSIKDLTALIKERAAVTPEGDWVLGFGYNDTALEEKRHPVKYDLDEVAPNHKVVITRTCGHIVAVNSLVLREFGITRETPDPEGGRIDRAANGEPTGVLYEQAKERIRLASQPSRSRLEEGLRMMSRDLLSVGITSVHEATGVDADEIRMLQRGVMEGYIKVRLYLMVRVGGEITLGKHFIESGLVTGFGNEKLKLGTYKTMLDGSGGGKSAAMRKAYPDDPNNFGITYMGREELDKIIMEGHRAGYQVGVHAIGDRAIEMVISSYEKVLAAAPRKDHRHRIEHCNFIDSTMMDRIRDLGIIPIMGVPFIYELGDNYIEVFDRERLGWVFPFASLLKRGIKPALHSDTPVTRPDPFNGIYAAVTRKTLSGRTIGPHEAVDVRQAIHAYTINGAYCSFEEKIKGSIEPGKLADLIVLSKDILKTRPEEIPSLAVDLTMVDGEIVYERA